MEASAANDEAAPEVFRPTSAFCLEREAALTWRTHEEVHQITRMRSVCGHGLGVNHGWRALAESIVGLADSVGLSDIGQGILRRRR